METFTVRDLRRRRFMTQGELAAALGVKTATVSGWENGVEPRVKMLQRLCEFFGVRPEQLIFPKNNREDEGRRAT